MKRIYFLSGLPRSGATLFSALMNQNPNVYSSPQTDLLEQMVLLINNANNSNTFNSGQLTEGYLNAIRKLPQNFYENVPAEFILDKNFKWGLPIYSEIEKCINPTVKIVCFYRPLLEVLSSFILQCGPDLGENFIDKGVIKEGYLNIYKDLNEARCEWLMGPEGTLPKSMEVMKESVKVNFEIKYLNIAYEDLVAKPKVQIEKVYKFLEIPEFEHTYENINYKEPNKDKEFFGLPNLHEVRKEIKRVQYDTYKVVPPSIVEKYKNL